VECKYFKENSNKAWNSYSRIDQSFDRYSLFLKLIIMKSNFMKILCIDIGTGTQDIYLFDSRQEIENGYKLVLPSPTLMVNRKLKAAVQTGRSVLLTGVTMGGGPSQWGANEVLKHGGKVYITEQAARTFNDDLEKVAADGYTLVSEDEAEKLPEHILRVKLQDLDYESIEHTFNLFGVTLTDLSAMAVAVFDHGAAPADISDRKFRFDYLDERIRSKNRLSAFAYTRHDIPASMTRLQSVAASAIDVDAPLVLMDTAPAAIMGSLFDLQVKGIPQKIIVNIGNFHTLAFRLGPDGIEGLFEHHTGLIKRSQLESYLTGLADGSLSNNKIFDDHGHGALLYVKNKYEIPEKPFGVIVTGPRRGMLAGSKLNPYFPAPFGDMMITGCFGLLAAVGDVLPNLKDEIDAQMNNNSNHSNSPWDIS
jgi:uncharacterized protein (DUF1786 family)